MSSAQFELVELANKGVPLNFNASQTKLYPRYIKVSFLLLFNGFQGVFTYTRQ
jgi:hypothetical protein